MKVLITGSNGFLGNALCIYLLNRNISVVGISKTKTTINHSNFTNILADLSEYDFTKLLPEDIDVIIHAVQSNHYKDNILGADDMFKVNIQSTFVLANWAYKNSISKFIFTSSGSVYSSQNVPIAESELCIPDSFYGASKLAAENILRPYQNHYSITSFRIFGLYGPLQKNKLIPNLIERIKKKECIDLAGGQGMIFNPIFLTDCLSILFQEVCLKNVNRMQIINLAGNEITDLGKIVQYISKKLHLDPNLNINNQKPIQLIADIELLLTNYNISDFHNVVEGLEKMI